MNLLKKHFRFLHYFHIVAKEESFVGTVERSGILADPLWRSVLELESDLCVSLSCRQKGKFNLPLRERFCRKGAPNIKMR